MLCIKKSYSVDWRHDLFLYDSSSILLYVYNDAATICMYIQDILDVKINEQIQFLYEK